MIRFLSLAVITETPSPIPPDEIPEFIIWKTKVHGLPINMAWPWHANKGQEFIETNFKAKNYDQN